MNTEIHYIPIAEIKPFVSRARPSEPFNRLKQSIKEMGLRVPIQVRELPRRKDGFKYELICGQGRMQACKELRIEKIPALIVDVPESSLPGRFLAENVLRKSFSWQEKSRLMSEEIKRIGTPTKADLEILAARYFVTVPYMQKIVGILKQASSKVMGEIDTLTVAEAAHLTSLPARNQDIVVDLLETENIPRSDMASVVKKAKEISEEGKELSKTALKQSVRRTGEELRKLRETAKSIRLKYALGPENLQVLLSDHAFRKALDKKKINVARFEEVL